MKLNAATLIHTWGLPTATFVYCFASGLLPFVNAEAFLIIISSALLTKSQLLMVTALATLGQMTAKCTMYSVARTSFKRPPQKYEDKLARARAKLEGWRYGSGFFIFVSAGTGFPPLYVISILAGMLKMNFVTFLVFGLAGRFIRFGIVLLFPQLLKSLL
jgi:membrane protein YqaA with SNARE-associated domain